LLPPAELNFPTSRKAAAPLDELQAVLETAEIKLVQPGDEAAPPAEAAPQPHTVEAPMEAPPSAPESMESPAAAGIETPIPAAPAPAEMAVVAREPDTDEFLFGSETPQQDSGLTDFRMEPEPNPEQTTAAARPPEAEPPKPPPRAPYDPLAPLRALSDEEKIALFS
jgi:hypothetical protein